MIHRKTLTLVAIGALCAAASMTHAATDSLEIDLDGWQSVGPFGDLGNTAMSFDIGAGSTVIAVAWEVELQTFGGSLAEEALLYMGPTSGIGAFAAQLAPVAAPLPNPTPFTGSADLVALGLDFTIDADGLFQLEAFELASTLGGAVESQWAGTLVIDYNRVPAPGAIALLGIAGLARRRRRG